MDYSKFDFQKIKQVLQKWLFGVVKILKILQSVKVIYTGQSKDGHCLLHITQN